MPPIFVGGGKVILALRHKIKTFSVTAKYRFLQAKSSLLLPVHKDIRSVIQKLPVPSDSSYRRSRLLTEEKNGAVGFWWKKNGILFLIGICCTKRYLSRL